MGDSSVSCALSGLTLHGESAVFVPLIKSKYAESLSGARLIGSGSQACAIFSPLTLPYRGVLDCYGRLESLDKDENTSVIESGLATSIEEFTDACIEGDWISINGERIPGAGCFIHPDVYDRFTQPIKGGKYAGTLWRSQFAGKLHLEAIGCKFSHGLGKHERYRFVYKHPAIRGISFRCDGHTTHVHQDATGEMLYGYGLDDIHIALKKAGFSGFPHDDIASSRTISELQEEYKAEAQALMKTLRLEEEVAVALETAPQSLHAIVFGFSYLRLMQQIDERLLRQYIEHFSRGSMLDRVEQLVYLLWSFSYANRLLMPTITGTQYPEHDITSIFAGCVDTIAKKRVRDKH